MSSIGWLSGHSWPLAAASRRASLRAAFSTRRSRSRASRLSLAIVVFFLPREAIRISWVDGYEVGDGPPADGCHLRLPPPKRGRCPGAGGSSDGDSGSPSLLPGQTVTTLAAAGPFGPCSVS